MVRHQALRLVDQHHQLPHRPIALHQFSQQSPPHRVRGQTHERRRAAAGRRCWGWLHSVNSTELLVFDQIRLMYFWGLTAPLSMLHPCATMRSMAVERVIEASPVEVTALVAPAPAACSIEAVARRLEERMADAVARLNEAHGEIVAIAAEAASSGAWAGPGLRSLPHWLTWQAGVSTGTARQVVAVVAARETHPALTAVFARGELTLDQVAMAVRAPAHCDAEFASLAPRCTVAQIHTMVRAGRTHVGRVGSGSCR